MFLHEDGFPILSNLVKKYKNPFVKATSLGKNSSKYTPKEKLGIPSRKRD